MIDGESFERKVNLNLNLKKFSVFVQTDKSIYKPSEKILFRVLLLDIDTKPFESSNVQIYITDGAQNRVKQFVDPKFKKGVFEGELELSDSPVMGNWTIFVKVDNHEERKEFEVAEYILPKFEVIVDSNPHVVFSDGKIRATVSGKYTFGKLAKGKATVTAKVVDKYKRSHTQNEIGNVEKIVDVDGKKDVEFDIREELWIFDIETDKTILIEAKFIEELSGKEHKGSTNVTIHKTAHKIEIAESNEKFKPGLPYSIIAYVKTHDGAPVKSDTKNPVCVLISTYQQVKFQNPAMPNCSKFADQVLKKDFRRIFLENGAAEISIDVSIDVALLVEISLSYINTVQNVRHISKEVSESGQYLQLKVLSKK